MSQPPAYAPQTEFLVYQAQQAWFPGQQLDVEFNDIGTSIAAIRSNLSILQNDDLTLGHGLVGWDQFAPSLQIALRAQGFVGAPSSGPNTWVGLQTFVGGITLPGTNTTAIVTDGYQLNVQNSATKATDILAGIIPPGFLFNDGIRSAVVMPAGSSVINLSAYGAYVRNDAVSTGIGSNSVGFFGIGISNVDGTDASHTCATWGANFALNDNDAGNVALATSHRQLNGIELDFTVASNNAGTNVQGMSVILNGLYGNIGAGNGFQVSIGGNKLAKWTNAFVADHGAISGAAFYVGKTAAAGNSIGSLPIMFARQDSGGIGHDDQLVNSATGTLTWAGAGGIGASLFSSSGLILVAGYGYFFSNTVSYPSTAAPGLALGYNFTGGNREVDFFNTDTAAAGLNSFSWYQQTGASAATLLAQLGPTGLNLLSTGAYEIGGNALLSIGGSFTQIGGSDGTSRIFVGNSSNGVLLRATPGVNIQNNNGSVTWLSTTGSGTFLGGAATAAGTVTYTLAGGLQIGNPTGGDKGAGAINMNAALYNAGNQVVGARATGWTVATGTPQRSTFTTGGVTLAQLAGVVMALEQDLIAHGLIGT